MPPKTKPTSSHSSSSSRSRSSRPSSSHSSSSSRSRSSRPSSSHSSSYKKSSSPSRRPSSSHSSIFSGLSGYSGRSSSYRSSASRNNAANALYGRAAAENARQQTSVPSSYVYHCPYCGGEARISAESTTAKCPNCNAVLNSSDIIQTDYERTSPAPNTKRKSGTGCIIVLVAFVLILIFAVPYMNLEERLSNYNTIEYSENQNNKHTVYVSALERDVPWSDEYESYYDKQTDCYFFKNKDVDPPIWQYWFEGISSNFGYYGWLEYDYKEQCWYVQVSDDEWEKLSGYDTSQLWHFNENE